MREIQIAGEGGGSGLIPEPQPREEEFSGRPRECSQRRYASSVAAGRNERGDNVSVIEAISKPAQVPCGLHPKQASRVLPQHLATLVFGNIAEAPIRGCLGIGPRIDALRVS